MHESTNPSEAPLPGDFSLTDMIITRVREGVAQVASPDIFDKFIIHRIERAQWKETPKSPGIYLLYGINPQEQTLTAYIGMSTTNMWKRIHDHHVTPSKNWFGTIFAIPVPSTHLCHAIEASMIDKARAGEAQVITGDNKKSEERYLADEDADIYLKYALHKICGGLQLLLGIDIFAPTGEEDLSEVKMDQPEARKETAVAVINKHNAIPDGAELRLRLGVFPTNQRSKVEEKISENERYAQVAWITNARSNQCLRWAFDGQNYSPSRLVREMLRDLGFGAGEKQGTLYWELPSGQSLVELADNYRQDDE